MAHRKSLSARQIDVLMWIKDGCVEGVMDEMSARISAGALRGRGLVDTSGRGPTWAASITPAGRRYLQDAARPGSPAPRQGDVSVTELLVGDLVASGGHLRVKEVPFGRGSVNYENRIRAAERHGKVPAGKRITTKRVDGWLQIDLVDAPAGTTLDLVPVPVPESVSRYHPAVRAFKERADTEAISRAALPRALRLLQAIAAEAERRGLDVRYEQTDLSGTFQQRRRGLNGQGRFVIAVGGFTLGLAVTEIGLPSRGHWVDRNSTYNYTGSTRHVAPRSEYETNATGRLDFALEVGYSKSGRRTHWTDTSRSNLESKLPDLLRELQIRAADSAHEALTRERIAAERDLAWQAAMTNARTRYAEHHRALQLAKQVDNWHHAQRIRSYADAIASAHPGSAQTEPWITWALQHADSLDPLTQPPTMPAPAEPANVSDLQPFLDGWSPYGSSTHFGRR